MGPGPGYRLALRAWALSLLVGSLGCDEGTPAADPWTFVSAPDWLNADLGALPPSADDGGQKGTTASLEAALDALVVDLASGSPEFLAVAGDLVGGHWSEPTDEARRIFGTGRSNDLFLEAAGDTYYEAWKERFAARDLLPIYAAVGDHDIGDNPWPAGSNKARQVPLYRKVFARHFTQDAEGRSLFREALYEGVPARPLGTPQQDTAYAVRIRNLLLVTVDVFHQRDPGIGELPQGTVEAAVVDGQLEWLDAVLSAADEDPSLDHVVVQGHVPVLTPVRFQSSSALSLTDGAASPFWKTLTRHHVSAYFAGEVHAATASQRTAGETVQVAHGRPPQYGGFNYLTVTVDGPRLTMVLRAADVLRDDSDTYWTVDSDRTPGGAVAGTPRPVGKLVLEKTKEGVQVHQADGWLNLVDAARPLLHYPLDEDAGNALNQGQLGNALYELELTATASRTSGVVGGALSFDGASGSKSTKAQGPIVGGSPRTLALWLRTTEPGLQDVAGWGSRGGFWLQVEGDRLRVRTGPNTWLWAAAPTLSDGQWHHVAVVVPERKVVRLRDLRVYLDGEPLPTPTASREAVATRPGGQGFTLGRRDGSWAAPFRGELDDVVVLAAPLASGEVRHVYEAALRSGSNAAEALGIESAQ